MGNVIINKENYESFLLDKAEGRISEENLRLLDEFLLQNPALRPQTDEYDVKICLKNFPKGSFPNKNQLFFHYKRRNVVMKYFSLAAIMLLLFGIPFFINMNRQKTELIQHSVAKTELITNSDETEQTNNTTESFLQSTKTNSKRLIDRDEKMITYSDAIDEKIVFDTLKLVRIDDKGRVLDEVFNTVINAQEIIINGKEMIDNENIVVTNEILTYETNH